MSHDERSPKGKHRSAPVLTNEQVKDIKRTWPEHTFVFRLADSHEALRAERDELQRRVPPYEATAYIKLLESERDAALAEVARLKASIMVWYDQLTTRDLGAIQGEMREAVSPTAPITAADIRLAMAAIASDPEVQP